MSPTNKRFTTLIEREGGAIRFEYEITYEFMPHESLKKLPRQVREQVTDLQYLHKTHPEQAIVSLLDLIEKYRNGARRKSGSGHRRSLSEAP